MAPETLPETTLTMIVRDEVMNPAGGLRAVLMKQMPYFSEVVVLDTGSVDGTRQLLEHLAGEYPQLRVYDAEFKGYASARTTANEYVRTKYTLMLDADERVEDYASLLEQMREVNQNDQKGINFGFQEIYLCGKTLGGMGWNPRLLRKDLVRFGTGELWESLDYTIISRYPIRRAVAPIRHFRYSRYQSSVDRKYGEWYGLFSDRIRYKTPPSKIPGFETWKTPSPAILAKYGVDVQAEIEELRRIGITVLPKIEERIAQMARCML